ncbi:hypothetical protein RHMOL_Rhmol10G0307000 [Rhododendron molle]|uniref:Uncharacterized protein n=1 Tax=Rhododendron molle TaxID=49168 RepID=A0ACC0M7Q4_RHOML|nr:hypothetical protein RHMOL_Rhmol10G0307000 [Rhododendron molle]
MTKETHLWNRPIKASNTKSHLRKKTGLFSHCWNLRTKIRNLLESNPISRTWLRSEVVELWKHTNGRDLASIDPAVGWRGLLSYDILGNEGCLPDHRHTLDGIKQIKQKLTTMFF